MSAWGEMRRRSAGKQSRKEDFFPCKIEFSIVGKGVKFPKSLAVPDDIRYQRCLITLCACDGRLVDAQFLTWAYIVGHKTFNDFLAEYNRVLSENEGFTYVVKDGDYQLTDKSREVMELLIGFVKKNNESVCGKPMPLDYF